MGHLRIAAVLLILPLFQNIEFVSVYVILFHCFCLLCSTCNLNGWLLEHICKLLLVVAESNFSCARSNHISLGRLYFHEKLVYKFVVSQMWSELVSLSSVAPLIPIKWLINGKWWKISVIDDNIIGKGCLVNADLEYIFTQWENLPYWYWERENSST